MSASDVAETYRRMLAAGLIVGTAGNVSERTATGMLITPSSLDPSAIEERHVCEFEFDIGLVSDAATPSSEWLLHSGVYARTDARAIVHTHSLAATAVSLIANELPAVHYYIVRLGGAVPVVPYALYGSEQLAESVAQALEQRHAAILQNHGTVTTGRTLDEALERAALLEWLCELYLKAAPLGPPHVLSDDQLAAVRTQAAAIAARGYRVG